MLEVKRNNMKLSIGIFLFGLLLHGQLSLVFAQSIVSTVLLVALPINYTRQGSVLVSINGGAYGAICDTNWATADATVICRQLGYDVSLANPATPQVNSAYGLISASPVITGVSCLGNEVYISNCPFLSIAADPSLLCSNSNYAGVTCFGAYTASTNTSGSATLIGCANNSNMQLVNGTGTSLTNGRLQVSQNGVAWGTVCSQGFTQTDAQVVCGALCGGISAYAQALPGSYYGQGSLKVVLTNVSCVGTESSILNCPSNGFNSSTNCADAVGINCAAQYTILPTGALTCGGSSMTMTFNQNSNPLITGITPLNSSLCTNTSSYAFSASSPSYIFTLSYTDCGTNSTTLYDSSNTPAYYMYTNTILITAVTSGSTIYRSSQFQMSLICTVQRTSTASNSYQTGIVNLPTQQNNYTVPVQATISFYADPGYSILLQPPVLVQLSTPIYVQVSVSQTAAALGYRVLVPTCVASPFTNFSSPLYYLIQNNCINDSTTIQFTTNSAQIKQFVFYSFRFTGNYTAVYLQCTTLLCSQSDFSGLCSGQCGTSAAVGRRKRDAYEALETFLINGPVYYSPLAAVFGAVSSINGSNSSSSSPAAASIIDRGSVGNVQSQNTDVSFTTTTVTLKSSTLTSSSKSFNNTFWLAPSVVKSSTSNLSVLSSIFISVFVFLTKLSLDLL